ncbi:MAG: cyclic nucleotide-binding domain-containing protein [Syntrophobacteraceae bacterium]|jgi:CRP-like cAMP-binding protein|nr:cyclic nucleotide-binding domain-containing protein [Syntrophobacteraceae bacterium]
MCALERNLDSLSFFAGLEPVYLRLITGCASEACFDSGETIFRLGEPADRFYIIEDGRAALEIFAPERGVVTVETMGRGDIVGVSWLFPPYLWPYDARAIHPTRAVAFNALCLRAACEDDHDLGYDLMKRFARLMVERLNATRLQLLDVYASPAPGRQGPAS